METVKGNMKMINTNESSATRNGAEKWGRAGGWGERKKGNQMDVIPICFDWLYRFLTLSSLLPPKQSANSRLNYFLSKRRGEWESERERKEPEPVHGGSSHCSVWFLKHLRVISLTPRQMHYSFCLSPISRLRILQENDTQFSGEVIDQARRNRIWASW